jgi:hypothetical protein
MTTQGTQQVLEPYKHTEKLSMILFIVALLFTIVTLSLLSITIFANNTVIQASLNSIVISLVASLVFTLLYLVVEQARSRSESQTRALEIEATKQSISEVIKISTAELSQEMERRISRMLEEEATRLVSTWPELLPKEYFPPSEESSPYFLKKLGEVVGQAQQYNFRGATARFVPELLRQHAKPDLNCSILIIDPRADIPLEIYARNRFSAHETDKTQAEHLEDIRQEIYKAIVDLFDLRQRFRIEIRLCQDNLFYRSELTNESAFVSFYVENSHIYPPTYFYTRDNGKFYYSAFRKDFQQSWDAAAEHFPIRAKMQQNDLEDFLVKISMLDKNTIAAKIIDWRIRRS